MTMDGVGTEIILIVAAILANGFFAASEIALVTARVSRLAQLRQRAVRGAAAALRLKQSPEVFLATIQIAITLVGALASAVGGAVALGALTPWVASVPALPPAWAQPLALGIVIGVITYFSLVVGELAPKAIALRHPDRIACGVAVPVSWLSRISGGLVRLLTISTNILLRLLGQGATREAPFVSEEEVKYLVHEGAVKGIFEEVEKQLVHSVFEFADRRVREVMVPRVDILGLDIDTPAEEILGKVAEIGRSRIPVYRDTIEQPLGVVTILDLFRTVARGEPPRLSALVYPPFFVPENARISTVLRELQRHRRPLALVVDEYGGLAGLVTIEDLLEEIVGEIRDEREGALSYVTRLPDGAYLVDGATPIGELQAALGIHVEDSPGYNTVAGLLIATIGAIPAVGVSVSTSGYRWTVAEMHGPRITRLRAERQVVGSTRGH